MTLPKYAEASQKQTEELMQQKRKTIQSWTYDKFGSKKYMLSWRFHAFCVEDMYFNNKRKITIRSHNIRPHLLQSICSFYFLTFESLKNLKFQYQNPYFNVQPLQSVLCIDTSLYQLGFSHVGMAQRPFRRPLISWFC